MIKLDIMSNMKTRKLPLLQSTELIQISAALHAVCVCVCVCVRARTLQYSFIIIKWWYVLVNTSTMNIQKTIPHPRIPPTYYTLICS